MDKNKTSADSLTEATRNRVSFSGHENAKGAAGVRVRSYNPDNCADLSEPGQSIAISPTDNGFDDIIISVEWDNIHVQNAGLIERLFKTARKVGVDLDLGCLYEMQDGTRGALQAFGKKFGSYDNAPFLALSDDERTGDKDGFDEFIRVNTAHWSKIKRVLVYIYIYEGAPSWSEIRPRIFVDVPGEDDLVVSLQHHNDALPICAIGQVENIRGGIKLTNYSEYFPGHDEMDRAFGFGLNWDDGKK